MEKQKWPLWKRGIVAAGVVICLGIAFYLYTARGYKTVFFPNVAVNGVDVSNRSLEEVKQLISEDANQYVLTITKNDGSTEAIKGTDIGLQVVFDNSLEMLLTGQDVYSWPAHLQNASQYQIDTMLQWDEEALKQAVEKLQCMQPENISQPENAYLSDYVSGSGYEIVPEKLGTEIKPEVLIGHIEEAVSQLDPVLSLMDLGCYEEADITAEDPELIRQRDERNHFVQTAITYQFGEERELLDGEKIHQWLTTGEDGQIVIDQEKAAEYIAWLAETYDTVGTERDFVTTYGPTVKVEGSSYGWEIDQKKEAEQLLADLNAGTSVEREPVFKRTAAVYGDQDYGSTYAEVNLTAQHLFLYKDGQKVLESDFVSGNPSRGHATPAGLYSVTYKQKEAVLKGEGYASPVHYWMPFNRGIGFHDASWRGLFGGSLYKTGGSHGCINMPYEQAKGMFETIYAGMPVICYHLEGTETAQAVKASGRGPVGFKNTQPAKPAQTAVPAETTPVETPPETEPQPTEPQEVGPGIVIQQIEQTPEGTQAGPGIGTQ